MNDYKSAGVDKEAGYETVSLIRQFAKKTHNKRVLGDIGSFGACYDLSGYKNPVLVSGTDGVGTKLKIAFELKKYDTVGIDLVAMCVNDILCHGAKAQYFLDYLACGKLEPEVAAQMVKGVAEGCLQADCALTGGETAEMPGFYQNGEYDIAGFAVGVVEKENLIDGSKVRAGDAVVGLTSSGFHSNGYSLLRKIFPDLKQTYKNSNIGEVLLKPTKIYVRPVIDCLQHCDIHAIAHITGGGFPENLPRAYADGLGVEIDTKNFPKLDLFDELEKKVAREECFATFNMGIGMVLILPADQLNQLKEVLKKYDEQLIYLGEIKHANEKLKLIY